MVLENHSPAVLCFGTFELDLRAHELRKQGVRIKIQEQPFQVLTLFLRRPGHVVTREELRSQIWHTETFVDFDNGLNTAINRLREALGDSADNPRFIETIPRRGYRFIAQVTTNDAKPSITPKGRGGRNPRTYLIILAASVALAIGGVLSGRFLSSRAQALRLTEKDTVVLADFANTTGDPVFDGTLRQGLAVELQQSPFFSLLTEEQIQQTLRMMQQPPDVKLTSEIAREICRRNNSRAVLDGSIVQIGTQYNVILRAANCSNAESLTSTEAQARDKSHVLQALGKASSEIRKKVGESLATIQKFDTQLVQATTPSLEALQAYSLGYRVGTGRGDSAAAVPFYRQAIKLDPNFAMAYSKLGLSYWNLGENVLASENIRQAFELHTNVSEWEKLQIESEYYSIVTGNLQKAEQALEVWAQTYRRDWAPRNQLGMVYMVLGQHDKALPEFLDAQRLYPESALIRGNIIYDYIALNRLEEARAVADEAKVKTRDSPSVNISLYRLAFLQDDLEGMKQQVALGAGKRGLEDELLWNEAATAAYFGKLERARGFYLEAVASAERAEEKEAAASCEAGLALTAALFGYSREPRQQVAYALRGSQGPDMLYQASLALALAGDTGRTQALAEDLGRRSPEDTIVQFVYLPTVQAQLALNRDRATKAIEILHEAAPYELSVSLHPVYVRGLAYLAAHQGSEAASEFQKILDHRGIVLSSPVGALAHLQIGRAFVMQGDIVKARAAYQDFLTLWKEADPDVPILKQAKAEYAKLQ